MKFWRIVSVISGVIFIIIGVLFFLFLLALNDPEIEGESGRISLGSYFISLIPIMIGVIILINSFLRKQKN
jgi:hypothetical protein